MRTSSESSTLNIAITVMREISKTGRPDWWDAASIEYRRQRVEEVLHVVDLSGCWAGEKGELEIIDVSAVVELVIVGIEY